MKLYSHHKHEIILLSAGLLVAMLAFYFLPFQSTSDSLDYYQWGLGLLGMENGHFPYHRSAGYPVILILSGIYLFNSSLLLEILQLAMAVITPLLLYWAISPLNRRAAFISAALMLILPFQFIDARKFMTEAPFLFFLILGYWGACHYIKYGRGHWIVLFSLLCASAIKPIAEPILFFVLPCLFLFSPLTHKLRLQQFIKIISVFIIISVASIMLRSQIVQGINGNYSNEGRFSLFSGSSMTGKMLFWQPYAGLTHSNIKTINGIATPTTLINESNGPASKELFRVIRDFAWNNKVNWVTLGPSDYFSKFAQNPDKLVDNIFARPNLIYHWFLWNALDVKIGPDKANELMKLSALEAFSNRPLSIWIIIDNFVAFFYGLDKTYNDGFLSVKMPGNCCTINADFPINPILSTQQQIQYSKKNERWLSYVSPNISFLNWEWVILRSVSGLLAVALFSITYLSSFRRVAILTWAFIIPQALIVSIFAAPHFRYTNLALPFINALALIGIVAAIQVSRRLNRLKNSRKDLYEHA